MTCCTVFISVSLFTDLQADIFRMEKTIANAKKELKRWLNFKLSGSKARARQIELLEKELRDMKESYDEMSGMVPIFIYHQNEHWKRS